MISTNVHYFGLVIEICCSVRSAIRRTVHKHSAANSRNAGIVSTAMQLCSVCVCQSAVANRSQSGLKRVQFKGTNPFLVLALLASIDRRLPASVPASLHLSCLHLLPSIGCFILPLFYSNFCLLCSIVLFNFVSLYIYLFYFSSFFICLLNVPFHFSLSFLFSVFFLSHKYRYHQAMVLPV